MAHRRKLRGGLTRVFAFALVVFCVLLLTQALTHSHEKGKNEAACHICQAAHLGAGPTAGIELLSGPLLTAGYVQPFVVTFRQEIFFHDSPFRAPPAA